MKKILAALAGTCAAGAAAGAIAIPSVVEGKSSTLLETMVGKQLEAEELSVDVSAGGLGNVLGGTFEKITIDASELKLSEDLAAASATVVLEQVKVDLGAAISGKISSVDFSNSAFTATISPLELLTLAQASAPEGWTFEVPAGETPGTVRFSRTETVDHEQLDEPVSFDVSVDAEFQVDEETYDRFFIASASVYIESSATISELAEAAVEKQDFSRVPSSRRQDAKDEAIAELTAELQTQFDQLHEDVSVKVDELTAEVSVELPELPYGFVIYDVTFDTGMLVVHGGGPTELTW